MARSLRLYYVLKFAALYEDLLKKTSVCFKIKEQLQCTYRLGAEEVGPVLHV